MKRQNAMCGGSDSETGARKTKPTFWFTFLMYNTKNRAQCRRKDRERKEINKYKHLKTPKRQNAIMAEMEEEYFVAAAE